MNTTNSNPQVVVSLTTFPAAAPYAAGAVKSVLRGTVLPDKVVLYLTHSEFEQAGIPVPQELLELERTEPRFEIRDYPTNIRSYRKLIPALIDFPDAIIVTIDDDVKYHRDMLRMLLELNSQYPDDILAHRAKRILLDKAYKKWPKYRWYAFLRKRIHRAYCNIQTGCAGVLYPPHSLEPTMLSPELFTSLAPTTDDIWFWGAAVTNGRRIIPVPFGLNKPKSLGKPKALSLKTTNFKTGTDRNIAAFRAILEHFPAIRQKIEDESR
ncbi:MAG: glycosyltransferase [Muribaculaceae bacterium]|nr:glycosyltransferase [Muribaculaceae bacterium]